VFSLLLDVTTGKGARFHKRRALLFMGWSLVPSLPEPEKIPQLQTVPLVQRLSLTLPECSALTGLKVCALRSAIWSGDLAFIRTGERGRYLIRRESLEQFIRSQEQREAR